jgi:membrane fusion protein (multidrug efflux system)
MLLLVLLAAGGAGLLFYKRNALRREAQASASQPEPIEVVTAALAHEAPYTPTTTAVGTVLATRSVELRTELPGTVHRMELVPGAVVEAGTLLVALDVAVEEAELAAQEARASLAEATLRRTERALENRGASEMDVDKAKAELDIARAEMERTRAIIERKTLRAPFRARVGLADSHVGQYLDAGAVLTTLQGVDDVVHVDFRVTQEAAAALAVGRTIEISSDGDGAPQPARIIALDARVDPHTRNTWVRAEMPLGRSVPGAAVRVLIPVGTERSVVLVPVSAVRKGPGGDHVYVLAAGATGELRASLRAVHAGPTLGDEAVILSGVSAGERVAAAGSFKLREGVRVVLAEEAASR